MNVQSVLFVLYRYNTANTSTGFSDNYRDRYTKRMGRIESQNSELSRRTALSGRLGDRGDSKYNKVCIGVPASTAVI